eukprot:CAMPEP_0201517018 /NCGR_PEP_ID=MMETSP0161_2-20130828/8235_1 /ASSEMBLY_ACC=CAM_ASM_000251 /TAXON_ID=180227 /ORGANISM="Neoparamoeba aestuarina, Strain SoJaBio B1-5/56/2" /LENGTH=482 /DNA_ID=CAMNT_0047914397 /DNA_START=772 /DNA_END=2220 /DNA_ORIENTATION=-
MGVDYIEVQNPAAGEGAVEDCKRLSSIGLKNSKLLAHTRCHMHDVKIAVDSGVQGLNVYMATSEDLTKHSHGKSIEEVLDAAKEVIHYVKDHGLEIRFSCEDAFRSNLDKILDVYHEVGKLGVNRVGVADTVGIATPQQVRDVISRVKGVIPDETGVEVHFHNDSGCCIANALEAIQAGATHIDTSVLGLGERNGITPLGGWLARAYTLDKEFITNKYNLRLIRHLERYMGEVAGVEIPFNNYITGSSAFTHKAGVHSKAVMSNPGAYEVINPADFGVERKVQLAHRLTGWNAMKSRVAQLQLDISDDQIKAATAKIKHLADTRSITINDIDEVLMKLAAGPRISVSSFVSMTGEDQPAEVADAARGVMKALQEYESTMAELAVSSIREREEEEKKSRVKYAVKGHLFDKAVLNRLLDILVDSPCEFRVSNLDVPQSDEATTEAVIELWGDDPAIVKDTIQDLDQFVSANEILAECTSRIIE